jgi:hypothetical protein
MQILAPRLLQRVHLDSCSSFLINKTLMLQSFYHKSSITISRSRILNQIPLIKPSAELRHFHRVNRVVGITSIHNLRQLTIFSTKIQIKPCKMSKRSLTAEQIHPSTKRAKQIDANPPLEELESLLKSESKKEQKTGGTNVIHWFRNQDLRIHDNKALHAASQFAQKHGKNLICILHLLLGGD